MVRSDCRAASRAPTADVDRIVQPIILLLTDYKFYTLFSMLFGVGFAMQLSRATERGGDVVRIYSRRLAILFCLGLGHALLLWFGDILHTYALVGFVLILFRNRNDRVLIGWAFGLAAAVALLPLLHCITATDSVPDADPSGTKAAELFATLTGANWSNVIRLNWDFIRGEYTGAQLQFDTTLYWYLSVLSNFLIGFVIGRRMLLQQAAQYLDVCRRVLPWALVIGLAGNAYLCCAHWLYEVWIPEYPSVWVSLTWVFVEFSMLSLSLAYLLGIVLLYQKTGWRRWLNFLAPVGRMALTNYLSQSVFLVVLFYGVGFGLLGKLGATACVVFSVLLFGFQIALSVWWLRRFRFGPGESAWRCLTYGKMQPMRLIPNSD